jgi:integrating conjugative element protein (TIGR03746 family)
MSFCLPEDGGLIDVFFKKQTSPNECKNKFDELRKQMRYRDRLILALLGVLVLVIVGWMQAPKDITVHYPPDLRSGTTLRLGEIPPNTVYTFAATIFAYLNTWHEDGGLDYPANRERLRAYLTPRYQREVMRDIEELGKSGELKGRVRKISTVPGAVYDSSKVRVLGDGSWVVWLDYRIEEYIRGTKVKDVLIRYPVRVVIYEVPYEANPYQLAIDGYEDPGPERLPYKIGDFN